MLTCSVYFGFVFAAEECILRPSVYTCVTPRGIHLYLAPSFSLELVRFGCYPPSGAQEEGTRRRGAGERLLIPALRLTLLTFGLEGKDLQ